ncbi:MAG: M28 family metallopeptidase [Acidobacteriaceae bacterium]
MSFCISLALAAGVSGEALAQSAATGTSSVFGYRDFSPEQQWEKKLMQVPDPALARQHMQTLTKVPHLASTEADHQTALYVAQKYREAGLDTKISEYSIWMNIPKQIIVEVIGPDGKVISRGPTAEHVEGDPFQDNPNVVMAYNSSSPSGDVTAQAIYVNYGRLEDFKKLKAMGVDMKGKIAVVRYGENFRGVKSYVANQYGCAGVIIYSDPYDDGYFRGDMYPKGPWRPASAVQRGSVQEMFRYSGDATTPGIASTMDLPASKRSDPWAPNSNSARIPTTPLSYKDARPILEALAGQNVPRGWQGALPFAYHVGPGPVKVHMKLVQDYKFRPIWDVTGTIKGSEYPDELVVTGNHRDAWVYGAVDPNSGSTAQLEAVHALGEMSKQGWKPKRTIIVGSWDAEEEGLIGSTEWVEEHAQELGKAVAYFNMDVGVGGPNFEASGVPALKQFIREVTKSVPSFDGKGTVYEEWKSKQEARREDNANGGSQSHRPNAQIGNDVQVGDLGSGSDYTPFFQHLGIPANDIGSGGPYGVYHSVFDDYNWYVKFGDPDFTISQQMARVYGVQLVRMADADVLPYDYELYGREIESYVKTAQGRAIRTFGEGKLDLSTAEAAAKRFTGAGTALLEKQKEPGSNAAALNAAMMQAERALLIPRGLPRRPWFRHAIYAPGEYTGYAAVVIPGVNEAIDADDLARANSQAQALADAINRAAEVMEKAVQ